MQLFVIKIFKNVVTRYDLLTLIFGCLTSKAYCCCVRLT